MYENYYIPRKRLYDISTSICLQLMCVSSIRTFLALVRLFCEKNAQELVKHSQMYFLLYYCKFRLKYTHSVYEV